MILNLLIVAVAAIGAVAGILYWPLRHRATKAYAELMAAEGDQIVPSREKYWSLDRKQKATALTVIACYGVGMLSVVILDALHVIVKSNPLVFWSWISLTVAMVAVGTIATIYNGKDTEERIKRDVERRYKF